MCIVTGDWLVMLIHLRRQLGWSQIPVIEDIEFEWSLKYFKLQNLGSFMIGSLAVSYGLYFGIGGFLHVSNTILLQNSRTDACLKIALLVTQYHPILPVKLT